MSDVVWFNGKLVRREEATVPATCEGWVYALGAFETMRWRRRGIFRFSAHCERLLRTLADFGFPIENREAVCRRYAEAVRKTVRANGVMGEAVVRLTVAEGVEMVHLREMPSLSESVEVYLLPSRRWCEWARHKTLAYLPHLLARREARARGCFDALWCDPEGFLLEGAATNLFLVKEGVLTTPATHRPFLPGVTRGVVLELALREGIPVVERDVALEELRAASEGFLTNAVVGVMPFLSICDASGERYPIGSGAIGETTRILRDAYEAQCEAELYAFSFPG